MSTVYHLEEIYIWENDIPFDELGYALYPGELYDGEKKPTTDRSRARYAREATNPYGARKFVTGSSEDFVCLDFCHLLDDAVVLHSIVNSERGGFIDEYDYDIVRPGAAPEAALGMIEAAKEWLQENNAGHDPGYWNQDEYYFYRAVRQACTGDESSDLRFGAAPE